jgi:xanthine dehydrogenase accessory factor
MDHPMTMQPDVSNLMRQMGEREEPYALATVVRTVSVTAAKAGAKAIILPDGAIHSGWIGGGCARAAVLKAAAEALVDGQARLVSIQPKDLLADLGVVAGEEKAGVKYAQNNCPSQGTMDIFVEPVLPRPELVIMGASPVALALSEIAPRFGFAVTVASKAEHHRLFDVALPRLDGFAVPTSNSRPPFIIVATQGAGDQLALAAALQGEARFVAFVGSRKKMASLRDKLSASVDESRLAAVKAPAGLDLGAITPDEIALSILAELIQQRRKAQRNT